MRTISFYFYLVCFWLAGSTAIAQSLNPIYRATGLPSTQNWQEVKLDNANPQGGVITQNVSDGVLRLTSTNAADKFTQLGWYKTGIGLNRDNGYTIEIRAKVIDAEKNGAFNIQGFDSEGKGFRIGIYKNYLAEQNNPLAATNVLQSGLSNDDGFHNYRIAVKPSGDLTLYRDNATIGTFPIDAFYFDNIIENGGFEDGNAAVGGNDKSPIFYPDFMTSTGDIYRKVSTDSYYVHSGSGALFISNEGQVMPHGSDPNYDIEGARTRELPVKEGKSYNISIARKRATDPAINQSTPDDWGWRDMGAWWNTQGGTQNGADNRNPNAMWAAAWENHWQIHNQRITVPMSEGISSLHFEFPSWLRNNTYNYVETAFDDFYFSEDYGINVGAQIAEPTSEPVFPSNFTNLIINGGFEDYDTNNDGSEYAWALSNMDEENTPAERNDLWGQYVRLQINDKPNDQVGGQWAHSGVSSMRYSTLDQGTDFHFAKELEANKTYRFNFWIRSPHWNERCNLNVAIGNKDVEDIIWSNKVGANHNNVWANADMTFTTTNDKKTLHFYLDDQTGWFNFFLDDLVLYEVTSPEADPHAGKTNLFPNGGFENIDQEIDGSDYSWELASNRTGDAYSDNYPVAMNDFWGAYLRIQDQAKGEDTGKLWARSGNNSLRVSYLAERHQAQAFEGKSGDGEENDPDAWQQNINMQYELEPNKTYTFVFWIRSANYPDRGRVYVANGDLVIWGGELNNRFLDWQKQTITFSTTANNHTLRMYTEFSGWFNFYLDDMALYKESQYVVPAPNDYLFFGKSMGTQSANVEIEYVAISTQGAYAPHEASVGFANPTAEKQNLIASSDNGVLTLKAIAAPASVSIYDVTGKVINQFELQSSENIALPKGVYIIKSTSQGIVETLKIVNK